ncbi:MAG: FtsX-like permease family protein, partial [Sporichthyaceae bacterium]|nr:FtsX-like permease family protein [Sporichthyaceae bacterium]
SERATNENVIAAVTVLVVATVVLLLAALVASASFVALAQRRARQLGMLAAVGATEKQLRSVTVVNGGVVGLAAGVLGCVVGIAGWALAASPLESAVDFRIDTFDLPWMLIAAGLTLTVFTATAAAWWPARTVARMSTVRALSGRPPEPRPAHRSVTLAALAAGIGLASLAIGGDRAQDGMDILPSLLILAGTVSLVLGLLLASPAAIRVLARLGGRLPVAVRLAWSDLSRYRARSGSALAAISLVLGIAATVVITTAATERATAFGNLAESQLLIRSDDVREPFVPDQADVDRLQPQVDRLVATLRSATVVPLTAALDPRSEQDPKLQGRFPITFARPYDDGWSDVGRVYVATPATLALHGRQLDDLRTGFLSTETGDLHLLGVAVTVDVPPGGERPEPERVTDLEALPMTYTSLPGSFVTPQELRARNWVEVPTATWLIQSDHPLTSEQLAQAQAIAVEAGLTIESRDSQQDLALARTIAIAGGMLVALGVLAMTVGLVRSESGRDLRLLTATGARRRTRRAITAATAGGLALLAAILGTATAYLGLIAGFWHNLETLERIPVLELVIIVLGVPLAATVAGWLVSGREPANLARQPME